MGAPLVLSMYIVYVISQELAIVFFCLAEIVTVTLQMI